MYEGVKGGAVKIKTRKHEAAEDAQRHKNV